MVLNNRHTMSADNARLELLRKRVKSNRVYLFKEEQRLSKLRWDLGTVNYKKHMLSHEELDLSRPHGPPAGMNWISYGLHLKCKNFRKALLKESQKLAKKQWELACCKTKQETCFSGDAVDV